MRLSSNGCAEKTAGAAQPPCLYPFAGLHDVVGNGQRDGETLVHSPRRSAVEEALVIGYNRTANAFLDYAGHQ
ncbi:MAG: hypothetical protein ACRDU4_04290, partial [Mycobacterium sp.]